MRNIKATLPSYDSSKKAPSMIHFGKKINNVNWVSITTETDGTYIEDFQGDYENIHQYLSVFYCFGGYIFDLSNIDIESLDKTIEDIETVVFKSKYTNMLRFHSLTNADVAEITGNTPESIKAVVNSGNFPRWAKLAIWMHEKFTRRSGRGKENEV